MKVRGVCVLVAVLLVGVQTSTAKLRVKSKETTVATETTDKKSEQLQLPHKEVQKRGIFHHHHGLSAAGFGGGALGAYAAYGWPKTYASHYGYGLQLPAASTVTDFSATGPAATAAVHGFGHAPAYHVKYPAVSSGFHYKTFSAGALQPSYATFAGALGPAVAPAVASTAHAHFLPHAHAAVPADIAPVAQALPVTPLASAHVPAPAHPYVIRPGGAVVSSYSVNFPQFYHKPAVALQPTAPVAPLAPVQPIQPFHHVQQLHPVAHVAPVQPIQPVQPVQSVQPLQPVHPVVQVSPVQPVAQIPFVPHQHLPHVHQYFQTSFVQPSIPALPALPAVPSVPVTPTAPALPAIPTFPAPPAFPAIPSFPAISTIVPTTPAIPTVPSIPAIPTGTPSFNPPVFTIGVQPPRPKPQPSQPPFVNVPVPPAAEVPGVQPLPGSIPPDTGSAEAAPQIPTGPSAPAEPEFPPLQPQPTQTPWKPIVYGPPPVSSPSDFNRPSITLLPPYGGSPAEAYLPPTTSQQYQQQQQQQQLNTNIFDNLSNAEIEHIFAQAAQQQQRHQQQQQQQQQRPQQQRYY